jgi:hypothetical protein
MSEEEKMRGEGGEGEEARVRQDFLALCAGLNMDQVCTSVGGSGIFLSDPDSQGKTGSSLSVPASTWIRSSFGSSVQVVWIRKYFFRIRICGSVIVTYGSVSRRSISYRPDPDPTWTFLWPMKKNVISNK